MNQPSLTTFFSAGGIAAQDINIIDVKLTNVNDVFVGSAVLPLTESAQKVVIYKRTLENGSEDLRAVSALCPHQGADISRDQLKPDGNVYCSLHKRPICIYSKYNQAFKVMKRDNNYIIVKTI